MIFQTSFPYKKKLETELSTVCMYSLFIHKFEKEKHRFKTQPECIKRYNRKTETLYVKEMEFKIELY